MSFRGRPRYLIAGRTHPKVLAAEGEAYRDARTEQARRGGRSGLGALRRRLPRRVVADRARSDPRPWSCCPTTPRIRSPPVFWSTPSRVAGPSSRPPSRTLSNFSAVGRASSSATTIPTRWHPPCASVLTDPRLAGSMAAEARRLAPTMAWPIVANAYLDLAQRILTERSGAGMTAPTMPGPRFDHLLRMTDRRGTFEHALSHRTPARARLLHRRHGPGSRRRHPGTRL